jgi:predicted DNA-binding transcriptional regulator AlpA
MGKQPQINDNDLVVELEDAPRSKPILISIKEVTRRTSLSRASIYIGSWGAGEFPRTVPLHGIRKAFVDSEISAWIESRIVARNVEASR